MSEVAPIPFSAPDITQMEIDAVTRVLRSGWITTGSETASLEEELRDYLGAAHVVAMSSCTAALETAYAFLGLPTGARVGVPTWTFVASALAPERHGATPILLDVDEDTLNLSADALEAAFDEGLDAVVAVHFGGVPIGKAIHELCAERGVPLIEDAAHALGATDHRGRVAGQGNAGACFSFYATKNLTSAEGGALATEDPELADFARSYRLHGLSRDAWMRYQPGGTAQYDLECAGIKANLPDVLAALARAQLTRFGHLQSKRRLLVQRYRLGLRTISGLRFVPEEFEPTSADHLVLVVLPEGVDRSVVVASLASEGIATSVHFQPLHNFRWFRDTAAVGPAGTPVADMLAARVLTLPLHTKMSVEDVDRVCHALATNLP